MSAPLGHPTQDESDRPFPKKARALGQWWARWRLNDTGWQPVRVRRYIHGVDHPLETGRMLSVWQGMRGTTRADDPDVEWGDPIPQPDEAMADALDDVHAYGVRPRLAPLYGPPQPIKFYGDPDDVWTALRYPDGDQWGTEPFAWPGPVQVIETGWIPVGDTLTLECSP